MTSILSFANQYQLFKFTAERTLLIVKGGVEQQARLEVRRQALNHSVELNIQQDAVDRQLRLKSQIEAALTPIRSALKPMLDLRMNLAKAKTAAQNGDAAGFDIAIQDLNFLIRSASLNPGDLTGTRQLDSAAKRTTVFGLGSDEATVRTQSLGVTYTLDLGGGNAPEIDRLGQTVVIGGQKYSIGNLTYVSNVGDSVTFTVDPGTGPVTYTADIRRGGLGLANAFFYGGLPSDASAESAAHRARAMADVDAAIKTLNEVERSLSLAEDAALAALDRASGALEDANNNMASLVDRQLSEQRVLERALSLRMDLATAGIALGAKTGLETINALFGSPAPLTDTILDRIGATKT